MRLSPPVASIFKIGRIVDCILVLMILELLLLPLAARRFGVRIPRLELVANLGAGAALLFALRGALLALPWTHTALWLMVALSFHLMESGLRWSRGRVH